MAQLQSPIDLALDAILAGIERHEPAIMYLHFSMRSGPSGRPDAVSVSKSTLIVSIDRVSRFRIKSRL